MTIRPLAFTLAALFGLSLATAAVAQDAPRPRPDDQQGHVFVRPRQAPPGAMNRLFRQAEPPKLGVHVSEQPDGILVVDVVDDSAAAAAGVQANDLLLSLDGQRLASTDDIRRVMAGAQPGSDLELSVVREGQGLVKLTVTVPEPAAAPDVPRADGHKGGFLGVELGQSGDDGVHVEGVVEQSAAWFAGMEKDDVLSAIDGEPVKGPEDVVGKVSSKAPGSVVALTWKRGDETREAKVRLGRRPQPFDGMLDQVAPGGGFTLPQVIPFGQGGMRWRQPAMPDDDAHRDLRGFQLFDDDGVWFGQPLQVDPDTFGADVRGRIQSMIEQLSKQLGKDIDLGDAKDFSIRIENGKVTIDKDGKTETYDLPADAQGKEIHLSMPGLSIFRTDGAADTDLTIRKDACHGPCEGNTSETGEGAEAH
jgi:hypothetical protein